MLINSLRGSSERRTCEKNKKKHAFVHRLRGHESNIRASHHYRHWKRSVCNYQAPSEGMLWVFALWRAKTEKFRFVQGLQIIDFLLLHTGLGPVGNAWWISERSSLRNVMLKCTAEKTKEILTNAEMWFWRSTFCFNNQAKWKCLIAYYSKWKQ